MEKIAEAFTAEHPNVTVEIQLTPYKEYFTKLQTAVSGGSAADVFWMNGPNFQLYASNGVLAPLDDQGGIDPADYSQGLVDLYTFDGKLYGAPKDFDTVALWYNKELFDAAGVAYPEAGWTWDDFTAAAAALTDPATGRWGHRREPVRPGELLQLDRPGGRRGHLGRWHDLGFGSPEVVPSSSGPTSSRRAIPPRPSR